MSLPRGSLAIPTARRIVDAAAVAFDVPRDELTGPGRHHPVALYRQITMAAARMAGHSFPQIGNAFERDHTTVIHACQRVAANPEWEEKAKVLAGSLTVENGSLF